MNCIVSISGEMKISMTRVKELLKPLSNISDYDFIHVNNIFQLRRVHDTIWKMRSIYSQLYMGFNIVELSE